MPYGDPENWTWRLRAQLPRAWFGDFENGAPILGGILSALAWSHAQVQSWIDYARVQTRTATATGRWLDDTATDFLSTRVVRANGETDDHFRARIRREILRPKATRDALIQAVTDLTGNTPLLVEPKRPADTGGYASLLQPSTDTGGVGFGVAGAYGSLRLHHQAFLTVYRPRNPGIPGLDGYSGTIGGYGSLSQPGGQSGAAEYVGLGSLSGVSDADIYECVASVIPAACVVWTQIRNPLPPGASSSAPRLDIDFTLDVSKLS